MPVNLQQEKRAVSTLAALYALRMLGLFLVLPVMSLYGMQYESSTAAWRCLLSAVWLLRYQHQFTV